MKNVLPSFEAFQQERLLLRKELRERTLGYVVAALSLIAGLAWNDAIKALIEWIYPLKEDTVLAKFIYAAIITFIVVIVTMILLRILRSEPADTAEKK